MLDSAAAGVGGRRGECVARMAPGGREDQDVYKDQKSEKMRRGNDFGGSPSCRAPWDRWLAGHGV